MKSSFTQLDSADFPYALYYTLGTDTLPMDVGFEDGSFCARVTPSISSVQAGKHGQSLVKLSSRLIIRDRIVCVAKSRRPLSSVRPAKKSNGLQTTRIRRSGRFARKEFNRAESRGIALVLFPHRERSIS